MVGDGQEKVVVQSISPLIHSSVSTCLVTSEVKAALQLVEEAQLRPCQHSTSKAQVRTAVPGLVEPNTTPMHP